MSRHLLALCPVLLVPFGLAAQERPIEVGIDGGLTFALVSDSEDATTISIPESTFRLGFFLSDRTELETPISFQRVSVEDFSLTTFSLTPQLLIHLGDDGGARPYVRFGGGLRLVREGGPEGSDTATQWQAGGGVGIKLPVSEAAFVRLEGNLDRAFESDDLLGSTNIGLRVGIGMVVN